MIIIKLFELLKEELCQDSKGKFAPFYFRAKGLLEHLSDSPSIARANGIYTLFTEPQPIILKNELIAGNVKLLYTENDTQRAKEICAMFPKRSFSTNADHYAPNYKTILSSGIPALIEKIEKSDKNDTLDAMKLTLCGFLKMIENYKAKAESLKGNKDYDDARLDFIIKNCNEIISGKPQSFAGALSLVWFCHCAFLMEERFAMALGRLDQYLYPFYKKDIESGFLTQSEAIELLENVFIKLEGDTVNICIGGQNERGECEVNELSLCILKAVRNCQVPGPNLSLRYTKDTPDEFLDECLKTIGTGIGYPAIMNDDINISALKKQGYLEKDVYDYCMVGCIENFISGKQPPWSDGRFDTPMYFDAVLQKDLQKIRSMDDFMRAFESEIKRGADEYVAKFRFKNESINQKFYPEPFLSCFCDGCIEKGLDINCGGSIYPSVHGVAVMGIATTADSLAAIEKVVFKDKAASLETLKNALDANFEGFENLREKLTDAPKYGNSDDFADKYAVWFIDFLADVFSKYKTRDGGNIYIAAAANVSNIPSGKKTNATPDGRGKGEPISDAASPTYGKDVRGATSTLSSLSKPDYTKVACGSVVNQKFSPSMFEGENRKKLAALIRTYFKKGGQQIQINATSRKILSDAMKNPQKYANLVVRVSGFSAFYVTLDSDVQLDILSRTQQE